MLSFALAHLLMTTGLSFAQTPAETLRRPLTEADGKTTYEVSRRAPSLYMISRDLYGTETHWRELAEWNQLTAPYLLSQGQRLRIETPASLGEAEADQAVAKAWTQLGNEAMAARIREQRREPAVATTAEAPAAAAPEGAAPEAEAPFESSLAPTVSAGPVVAPVPAPAAEASPVVTPPTPATPVATEAAPAVTPVVTAAPVPAPTPAPCTCAARPSPVPATALEDESSTDGEPMFRWQWRADLVTSMFALDSTRNGGASQTRLNSRLNYGLEVEALYRFTNQLGLGLVASSERVSISTPESGRSFRQIANDFTRGGLIARARPSEAYALHLGVAATERPFPLMTTRGLVLRSAILPEFTFGADIPFVDAAWSAAMLVEGIYTSPTSDKYFDVSSGYGAHAGVRAEVPYGPARITAALRFRYLNQDTSDTKNNIRAGVLNLGVTW